MSGRARFNRSAISSAPCTWIIQCRSMPTTRASIAAKMFVDVEVRIAHEQARQVEQAHVVAALPEVALRAS